MSTEHLSLTAVIPAYNEADCISKVVLAWSAELRKIGTYKIIVINDGSRDNTGEILDQLAAQDAGICPIHQRNSGHGAAIIKGYNEALRLNSQWVFQVDSDDQFSPSNFADLWNLRESSPFILGQRKTRRDPLHRRIISGILRTLIALLFFCRIKDPNVPFRLIKRECLAKILPRIPRNTFAPNIFLSIIAARDGIPLIFVPVSHRERSTGKVSIIGFKLLRSAILCAIQIVRLRVVL